MSNINSESILKQFNLTDASLYRAKLIVETGMLQDANIEVVLWELIKAKEQITNMIREISPDRFAQRVESRIHIPEITVDKLFLCNICGTPNCQSDHK